MDKDRQHPNETHVSMNNPVLRGHHIRWLHGFDATRFPRWILTLNFSVLVILKSLARRNQRFFLEKELKLMLVSRREQQEGLSVEGQPPACLQVPGGGGEGSR